MSLQPPTKPVFLRACGTTTSVGLTTAQTASAVRSGISAYEESSVYNKQFRPMTMALLPEDVLPVLDAGLVRAAANLTSRQSRMLKIAHLALDELSEKFDLSAGLPLMLAGPDTLPGMTEACHPALINHIVKQTGIAFHERHNMLLPFGRAAGVKALQYAMAYVEAGMSDYAIIGGVDTYLDLYLLSTLDMDDRILADGVMDGFAPGEGAGFFVIGSEAEPFEGTGQKICIFPPGIAQEPGHRFSDEPYRGDGLAESFAMALAQADSPGIKTILASLNGENFGGKELGVAVTRNSVRLDEDYVISHPGDCFGDTGAAFFPVSIGLSAMGFAKNYLQSPILSYASSEAGYRGAACLSRA